MLLHGIIFIQKNSTIFRKLIAISCKYDYDTISCIYYYYCWIHITEFVLLLIIISSSFYIIQHINIEQQYLVINYLYYTQALNWRLTWGSSWFLWAWLDYSWNSRSTLVKKLSLVRYPSHFLMITNNQVVASHQKAHQFWHLY